MNNTPSSYPALSLPASRISGRRRPLGTQMGFTIVELVIVMAIAGVFATVAVPNMSASMIRSDLVNANANVSQALRKAKNEARGRNTSVSVTFTQDTSSFTITSADGALEQTVTLSSKVTTTSGDATYQFSPLGTVNATGAITLTSTRDNTQSRDVTIANLLGQITTS